MKLFKLTDDFIKKLRKGDPITLKKVEIGVNLVVILFILLSISFGGEVIVGLIMLLPMNRIIKVIISPKKMSFGEKWIKGALIGFFYFFIELIILKILANFIPYIDQYF